MDNPAKIGFIGLGAMGLPMAKNLIAKLPKGSETFVYDVSKSAMENLTKVYPESSVACGSPKEVAEKAVSIYQPHSL